MVFIKRILQDSLLNLNNSCKPEELAFLSLTSKSEISIRDKISFWLYKQLFPEFHISREWKKVDIAILKEKKPVVLIELKAMYTFDCYQKWRKLSYPELMLKDLYKAQKLALEDTEIYGILIATHVGCYIPPELEGVIKYSEDINFIHRQSVIQHLRIMRTGNKNQLEDAAIQSVLSYFEQKKIEIDHIAIRVGEAYRLPVSIHFFIVGPINKDTKLIIP